MVSAIYFSSTCHLKRGQVPKTLLVVKPVKRNRTQCKQNHLELHYTPSDNTYLKAVIASCKGHWSEVMWFRQRYRYLMVFQQDIRTSLLGVVNTWIGLISFSRVPINLYNVVSICSLEAFLQRSNILMQHFQMKNWRGWQAEDTCTYTLFTISCCFAISCSTLTFLLCIVILGIAVNCWYY